MDSLFAIVIRHDEFVPRSDRRGSGQHIVNEDCRGHDDKSPEGNNDETLDSGEFSQTTPKQPQYHSSDFQSSNPILDGEHKIDVNEETSSDLSLSMDFVESRYVAHVFLSRDTDASVIVEIIKEAFKGCDRQISQTFAVTEDIYME